MEITLTPEIEEALRTEADEAGLAPAERAAQILGAHTGRKRAPLSEEQRQAILDRFEKIRSLNLPGPPEGMRFRDWIHLGHKY
jgi:hypothetical protein